jgi:hypothetical protein
VKHDRVSVAVRLDFDGGDTEAVVVTAGATLNNVVLSALVAIQGAICDGAEVVAVEVSHFCRSCDGYHPADPADQPAPHNGASDDPGAILAGLN